MTDSDREVALVSEYFHPDSASTGQLMTDLAVGLQDRGLDVTAYTSQPNYHGGGNDRRPASSTYEGVRVERIRAPQLTQSSVPRRAFNWAVFVSWMTVRLLVSRPESDRELLFVTCPPVLPLAMWGVARLRGWEYTYVVYDVYPDTAVELGYLAEGGPVHRAWATLHRRVLADAENVVALGPVMREHLLEAGGDDIDSEDLTVIHNWEEKSFIKPRQKVDNPFSHEHGLIDRFSLLYSGNVGAHHDLMPVVEAAAAFDPETFSLLVIGEGEGKDEVVDLADDLGVRDRTVSFLPYQPLDRLPLSLTCGDVSIVSVREGFSGLCVSCKLYSALAAGQPILLIAEAGTDEARIVADHDAGIRAPPDSPEAVRRAVETWQADPELVERQGANAREAFEDNYTKERSIDAYYELLTGRQVSGEIGPERTTTA